MIVIMNKGEVYKGVYFENEQIARNFVKFSHPYKKWFDVQPNIMKCKRTGMCMQIVELSPYKSIQSELSKATVEVTDDNIGVKFNADTYDYLQYKKDHI